MENHQDQDTPQTPHLQNVLKELDDGGKENLAAYFRSQLKRNHDQDVTVASTKKKGVSCGNCGQGYNSKKSLELQHCSPHKKQRVDGSHQTSIASAVTPKDARKKMPPMSVLNGNQITELSDEEGAVFTLEDLEATLIATNIIFMKVYLLPSSRWCTLKDRVVNVPINDQAVCKTVSSLPRLPSDAAVVPVKLKRKKDFKATHQRQYIRPNYLISAIKCMKRLGNKLYDDINIDDEYVSRCLSDDKECYNQLVGGSSEPEPVEGEEDEAATSISEINRRWLHLSLLHMSSNVIFKWCFTGNNHPT